MIHRLAATAGTKLYVMADEDTWCDIVVTKLAERIHEPVDLVVRLAGSIYPKRIAQTAFLQGYQAWGFYALLQDAPPNRSDWQMITCQDFLPTYSLLMHPSDVAGEIGPGECVAVEIGADRYRDMARELQAWHGVSLIPAKLYRDPFNRGDQLRAPYER
jgi:hypothetical protein